MMNNWLKYNGSIIPSSPPHIMVTESKVEIKKLLISSKSFLARWVSNFDVSIYSSFWYVINDKGLGIEDYSKNTRSKIRRGLKNFVVKKIEKSELINHGYKVYVAAFKRYKTINKPMSSIKFIKHINSLDKGWEFWGVYSRETNELIAYSQNKIVTDQCYYSTIKFHEKYLKMYSSYALYFVMNSYYLKERKLKYVNEGTRSILHETNVQSFLIDKFKFRKAYCKLHVQYHPLVTPIIFVLYPFRKIIVRSNLLFFRKIGVVLSQEQLHRNPNE